MVRIGKTDFADFQVGAEVHSGPGDAIQRHHIAGPAGPPVIKAEKMGGPAGQAHFLAQFPQQPGSRQPAM